MQARVVTEEQLEVRVGGSWRAYPCSLFSSTPGTGGEWRSARARRAWRPPITSATTSDTCAARRSFTSGVTSSPASAYRRLMAAGPGVSPDGRHPLPGRHAARRRHVPRLHRRHRRRAHAERGAPGRVDMGGAAARPTARCRVVGGMVPRPRRTSSSTCRAPISPTRSCTRALITIRRPPPPARTTTGRASSASSRLRASCTSGSAGARSV